MLKVCSVTVSFITGLDFLVIHCRQSLALLRVQKEAFEKELDFRHIFKFYFFL